MKKLPVVILAVLLCLSLAGNGVQLALARSGPDGDAGDAAETSPVLYGPGPPLPGSANPHVETGMPTLHFGDANSRPTYFTVHNVAAAQAVAKGAGVKVGILDWSFDAENRLASMTTMTIMFGLLNVFSDYFSSVYPHNIV